MSNTIQGLYSKGEKMDYAKIKAELDFAIVEARSIYETEGMEGASAEDCAKNRGVILGIANALAIIEMIHNGRLRQKSGSTPKLPGKPDHAMQG